MGSNNSSAINNEEEYEEVELPDNELKALHSLFDQDIEKSLENLNLSLKNHLQKVMTESMSTTIVEELQKRASELKSKQKKMSNFDCLIASISKLLSPTCTHDVSSLFLYQLLQHNGTLPHLERFSKTMYSVLKALKQSLGNSPFKINEEALDVLIASSVEPLTVNELEALTYGQIYEIFESSLALHKCYLMALRSIFLVDIQESVCHLKLPMVITPTSDSMLSSTDAMFLCHHLDDELSQEWKCLYSSQYHGESFTRMSTSITNQGPLVIVVADECGHVFGGHVSTNMKFQSDFQGNVNSFVFSLRPTMKVYSPTGFNDHYAYLNINQQSLPNGLAMGGQHNYFGFFLSDYYGEGHSKAKPSNTTFGSPQLSSNDSFKVTRIEVWGVGRPPATKTEDQDDDDEEEVGGGGNKSVLDKNREAAAMLQVMGKERVSEGFRDE